MKTCSLLLALFLSSGALAQNRADSAHIASRVKKMRDTLLPFPPQLKVFPNPVQNRAELEVKYFDAGEVTVQIVNNGGKMVYEARRLVTGSKDQIVLMLQLPAGIYFCTVQQKQKRAKIKLVVAD